MFADSPQRLGDFANSFSATQHTSKQWLVNKVKQLPLPKNPQILIMGGWYGSYLVPMLMRHLSSGKITFNDQDPFCVSTAKALHQETENWVFEFNTHDMNIHQWVNNNPFDLIINTSCEHMNPMRGVKNVNPRCVYAFQSSNTPNDPGHINICNTSIELREQSGLTEALFQGSISLHGDKKRFMVIGRK